MKANQPEKTLSRYSTYSLNYQDACRASFPADLSFAYTQGKCCSFILPAFEAIRHYSENLIYDIEFHLISVLACFMKLSQLILSVMLKLTCSVLPYGALSWAR